MRIGVIFPATEISEAPAMIREFAQAVEDMGYTHILAFDHVLGTPSANDDDSNLYHEPLVLFGYLAAITRRVEFMTGVIVLPQRQTALVAKQCAEVDVLSGGRLRLGVGVGWNEVEFEALNENFHNRGARIDEQVEVLRALWTQPVVTFHGRWHHISEAGLNPLPVQRPIPIWFGGHTEAALRRVGRLGDGWWYPQPEPGDEARAGIERIHQYAREAGRDPGAICIGTWLRAAVWPEDEWKSRVQAWRELGATHVSIDPTGGGLAWPHEHIKLLRRVKEVIGV